MNSHRIHLKGPWQYHWLAPEDSASVFPVPAGTVTMPCDWQSLFGDVAGTVQFRRRFHRPTNLESHETVMIVLTEVRGEGAISLNGKVLGQVEGTGGAAEFDITASMIPFNQLVIDLRFDPSLAQGNRGGLYGPVALDIRSSRLELN